VGTSYGARVLGACVVRLLLVVSCGLLAGCGTETVGWEPGDEHPEVLSLPVEETPPGADPAARRVVLGSDEGTFAIRGAAGIERDPGFDSTLLEIGKDWYGDVVVLTGSQFGPFAVRTRVLDSAPPVGDRWEDVDEVSIEVAADGVVATELVANDPSVRFVDEPGSYRVRVSARGRMSDWERQEAGLLDVEDDVTPVETYLLEAWPAEPSAPTVVRESSAYAAETRRGA
jgi:hypothetical protein